MTIREFIEYAKVFEKYIDLLEQEKYEITLSLDEYDEFEAVLSLNGRYPNDELDIMTTSQYRDTETPKDIEDYIKGTIIATKKEEYLKEIQELQERQKKLENLIKTIDN